MTQRLNHRCRNVCIQAELATDVTTYARFRRFRKNGITNQTTFFCCNRHKATLEVLGRFFYYFNLVWLPWVTQPKVIDLTFAERNLSNKSVASVFKVIRGRQSRLNINSKYVIAEYEQVLMKI